MGFNFKLFMLSLLVFTGTNGIGSEFRTPTKEELNQKKFDSVLSNYDDLYGVIPEAFHSLIDHEFFTDKQQMQLKYLSTILWKDSNIESTESTNTILTGSFAIAFWATKYNLKFRKPNDIDLGVISLWNSKGFYPLEYVENKNFGASKYSSIVPGKENYFDTDFILLDCELKFASLSDLETNLSGKVIPVLPPSKLLATKLDKLQEQKEQNIDEMKISETESDIEILKIIVVMHGSKVQKSHKSNIDSLPMKRKLDFSEM